MSLADPYTLERRKLYTDTFENPTLPPGCSPEYSETVDELAGWCHWLFEKLYKILAQSDDDFPKQVRLVGHRMDLYLFGNPHQFEDTLRDIGQWSEGSIRELMSLLESAQQDLLPLLGSRGLERIGAHHGRTFEPGVINRKEGEGEPTSDAALHDRICRLDPGDGGYRLNGEVLFPSRAIRYNHVVEEPGAVGASAPVDVVASAVGFAPAPGPGPGPDLGSTVAAGKQPGSAFRPDDQARIDWGGKQRRLTVWAVTELLMYVVMADELAKRVEIDNVRTFLREELAVSDAEEKELTELIERIRDEAPVPIRRPVLEHIQGLSDSQKHRAYGACVEVAYCDDDLDDRELDLLQSLAQTFTISPDLHDEYLRQAKGRSDQRIWQVEQRQKGQFTVEKKVSFSE